MYVYTPRSELKVMIRDTKRYWDEGPPMTFYDLGLSYEKKRRFRYQLQDYMHGFFKFEEHNEKLILDVGCGSGIDSLEFARFGAQTVSVDFSDSAVLATWSLYKEAKLDYIGSVVQADACFLPFRDAVFDVVYSFGVLHYIPNVRNALEEIRRILKGSGKLMGMVYNKDSLLFAYSILYLKGVKEGLIHKLKLEELECMTERRSGNPYTKLYTRDELHHLLSQFFKNVKIKVKYNVIDTCSERESN